VPKVPARHEDMARTLIPRAGGAVAFGISQNWCQAATVSACAYAAYTCVEPRGAARPATAGNKRQHEQVASVKMRQGVWSRYGSEQLPELTHLALRLLSKHPTSASAKHNWALWGRAYAAARNALGLERAKKLITFCFNSRRKKSTWRTLPSSCLWWRTS
jgi:hypothetical protein